MLTRGIPHGALAFASAHLTSVQDLEVLILLMDSGKRWWDAKMLAHEAGIPAQKARRALDRFAKHNLLDIRVTGEVRYQFRPGTHELEDAARSFAKAYRLHHTALARAVAET